MKKALFILALSLIISMACAPSQTTAPSPAPSAPPPAPAQSAPAETKPLTPESVAASFNLPYVALFNVKPVNTVADYPVTIKWDVKNAADVMIEPNVGIVQPTGQKDFTTPFGTTTYKLTATNAQGSVIATTTLTISGSLPGRDAPVIRQFTANPHIIKKGQSSNLVWTTAAASAVTLDSKTVAAEGSMQVSPAETTTYNLIATSTDGTQYQAVTVNVK
jgi:hypothetical protein